jgi:uncharacterized protein YggE
VLLLSAIVIVTAVSALATESEIVVTATGSVRTSPDVVTFRVVIRSLDISAVNATKETAKKHSAIQRSLRDIGIDSKDSPTVELGVKEVRQYDKRTNERNLRGFQADHTVLVRVYNLQKVGSAIDAVIRSGAQYVSAFEFITTQYDSLRQIALDQAVKKALLDAEAIAKAAGGSLGPLLEITTQEAIKARGGVLRPNRGTIAMSVDSGGTEVMPAEKVVSVTVLGRWVFLNGDK